MKSRLNFLSRMHVSQRHMGKLFNIRGSTCESSRCLSKGVEQRWPLFPENSNPNAATFFVKPPLHSSPPKYLFPDAMSLKHNAWQPRYPVILQCFILYLSIGSQQYQLTTEAVYYYHR